MNAAQHDNRPDKQISPDAEFAALDHILAGEDSLAPSSGFLDAVMERVREEAVAPKPIPFPWRRIAPGIALAAGVFGWGAYEFAPAMWLALRQLATGAHPAALASSVHALAPAGWTVLALVAALLAWLLSRRIAGESGLL